MVPLERNRANSGNNSSNGSMSKFRYEKEREGREEGQGGKEGGEGGVGWQGRGPLAGWDGTRAADVLTVSEAIECTGGCLCVRARFIRGWG